MQEIQEKEDGELRAKDEDDEENYFDPGMRMERRLRSSDGDESCSF